MPSRRQKPPEQRRGAPAPENWSGRLLRHPARPPSKIRASQPQQCYNSRGNIGVVAMNALKIRQIGNSLGVVLPKEALSRLNVKEGDQLFLTEAPDGSVRLTPYDPDFEKEGPDLSAEKSIEGPGLGPEESFEGPGLSPEKLFEGPDLSPEDPQHRPELCLKYSKQNGTCMSLCDSQLRPTLSLRFFMQNRPGLSLIDTQLRSYFNLRGRIKERKFVRQNLRKDPEESLKCTESAGASKYQNSVPISKDFDANCKLVNVDLNNNSTLKVDLKNITSKN